MATRIKLKMDPVQQIIKSKGLSKDGDVQLFTTNTINRRMTRYMPYRTGVLSTKNKRIKSNTEIEILGPYARVMYYGKVMVDPITGAAGFQDQDGQWKSWTKAPHVPKVVSDRTFNYTKTHPLAGPFWDQRMMSAEKKAIVAEIQRHINMKKGKL